MNERFASAKLLARVDLAHEPDFDLGEVRVRPSLREIAGNGWQQILEPRIMQVLVALERAQGQVISRDDLIEACWDGRIVGEDAIERCIGRLRKLSDQSSRAFSVETVPRVGYRLRVAPPADALGPEQKPNSRPEESTALLTHLPHGKALGIAAAIVLVLLAGAVLWRWWPQMTTPSAPAGSVAVLPFVNMSGDPAKEYFSDGFAEEIIDDLSNDPGLRVASRASAFAFRGKRQSVEVMARTLHVRALVGGSVREFGNRVRIAVQLIDGSNGYNIWSTSYDGDLSDILSLQDDVARKIAVVLTHRLAPDSKTAPRRIDPAVYRLYLQARREHNRVSHEGELKAFALLKQVTTRQPDFADGFAALSNVAFSLAGADPAHDAYSTIADTAANRAVALDPHNVLARAMRATLELANWNWQAASSDLRALRAQNPDRLQVLAASRAYYIVMGFPDKAIATSRHLLSLYPSAERERIIVADLLLEQRRLDEAIAMARDVLSRSPDQPVALQLLCQGYAGRRQLDEGRKAAERLRHTNTDRSAGNLNDICALDIDIASGDDASARRILENWAAQFPDKFTDAKLIGDYYAALHDFEQASDWYEHAYQRRDPEFFSTTYKSVAESFRAASPRWKALTQQRLFKSWQAEHDRIAAETGS